MLQVYTGDGKGKTTAAFGLALRAFGRNKKVAIIQFAKPERSGEFMACQKIGIEIYNYGYPGFIIRNPREEDFSEAEKAWKKAKELMNSDFEIIILDELNIALYYNLIDLSEVLKTLMEKKEKMEIVITGRYAKREILEIADLVTEMKMVKHYFDRGIPARQGIEY
ncbi:MAG: cob(I)yrinic acid a,c-diamide adenosyltransferase [Thermoplasmata archaeon]